MFGLQDSDQKVHAHAIPFPYVQFFILYRA